MKEAHAVGKDPVFFHVHVRKCGGSTFYSTILNRNFGEGFYRDRSLIEDRYTRAQVHEVLSKCPWLAAYSSHKISLDLPYDFPTRRVIAIALVRDPLDRFSSIYHYLHHHQHNWDPAAKQLTLSEYALQAVDSEALNTQRRHSQIEQLTNLRGQAGLSDIKKFCKRDDVWMLPMDRFDDVCILLEQAYPDKFCDASYATRSNRSKVHSGFSDQARQTLIDAIDPAEFQVVELAHQLLDQRLNRCFPNLNSLEAARNDFAERSASLRTAPKTFSSIWNWFRG